MAVAWRSIPPTYCIIQLGDLWAEASNPIVFSSGHFINMPLEKEIILRLLQNGLVDFLEYEH
jgi:hypothetical protein